MAHTGFMTTILHADHDRVAVIGLGPMGAALARALLGAGISTTVWNRTASRTESLAVDGAAVASSPSDAFAAADLVLMCLRDHDIARDVLGDVDASAYAGRAVVNLTSATPEEARASADWAAERGVTYLTGAIMVPTPMIGNPEALILYAGDHAVFARHEATLRVLAGHGDHLGENHGLAPVYDVAMLEIFFAAMTSFLHAAALVNSHGVDAKTFLPYAQQIVSILPDTINGLAGDVDRGEYPGEEDNIAMEVAFLDHIVAASQASRLDSRLPELMRDLGRRAVDSGSGAQGWSAVVEVLRQQEGTSGT